MCALLTRPNSSPCACWTLRAADDRCPLVHSLLISVPTQADARETVARVKVITPIPSTDHSELSATQANPTNTENGGCCEHKRNNTNARIAATPHTENDTQEPTNQITQPATRGPTATPYHARTGVACAEMAANHGSSLSSQSSRTTAHPHAENTPSTPFKDPSMQHGGVPFVGVQYLQSGTGANVDPNWANLGLNVRLKQRTRDSLPPSAQRGTLRPKTRPTRSSSRVLEAAQKARGARLPCGL